MGHYLINTLWECELKCPYCLLPHIKINRTAPHHSWAEWVVGLRDFTEPGSILDFGGGDPFLMDGLPEMLRALAETGRYWALTTPATNDRGVDALVRARPPGCVLINVSDHPGNYKCEHNIAKLQTIYRVVFNRVDYPLTGHRHDGDISSIIPYQSYREGTELDGIRRRCDSGLHHFIADPGGDLFRCNPWMAMGRESMGNLFKRTVRIPEPIICEDGCSTCYTSVPTAWPVTMVPV
jgi:hypothetical protein